MTNTATAKSIGNALIVCEEAPATRLLIQALQELALSAEVWITVPAALDRINHHKMEVAVVDFSLGERAVHFLEGVRTSASNRTAVTFAVTNDSSETARALKAGASFALERPLTLDSIRRTFRAAYGLIVRERRRYFRYSLSVPVALTGKGMPTIFGKTVNISESGMAFSTSTPLTPGAEVSVQVTLPDPRLIITADCRVRWNNDKGEVGVSFLFLPFSLSSELQAWLARKLEEQLPDPVALRSQQPTQF